MQPNRNYETTVSRGTGVLFDAGLQAHMQRVYNRMTMGVVITGITSYFVAGSDMLMKLFLVGPQAYIVMLAPLAVVWFGFRPDRMNSGQLRISFILLSVLYGISFATIFKVFTGTSIAQTFFMATALFAGLSLFGYTTKKNLSGLGTFAMMGMWGVLILALGTMVAGLFGVQVTGMNLLISGIGLLAFSGLTAWETQSIKEMYNASYGDELNSRMAWAAALNLYISFVAIFQYLLQFFGNRK